MNIIKCSCVDFAVTLFLQELCESTSGYDTEAIDNSRVNDLLKPILLRRGATAYRFLCYVNELDLDTDPGCFFLVVSRRRATTDIVYVSEAGAFVATSSFYAAHGFPGKHILSVYVAGYCKFSVEAHLNPLYIQPQFTAMKIADRAKYGISSVCRLSDHFKNSTFIAVVWNHGQLATNEVWEDTGKGGVAMHEVAHPTVRAIKAAKQTKDEEDTKCWRAIQAAIKICPDLRIDLATTANIFTAKAAIQAEAGTRGRGQALGGTVANSASSSSTTPSKKRGKTSKDASPSGVSPSSSSSNVVGVAVSQPSGQDIVVTQLSKPNTRRKRRM